MNVFGYIMYINSLSGAYREKSAQAVNQCGELLFSSDDGDTMSKDEPPAIFAEPTQERRRALSNTPIE